MVSRATTRLILGIIQRNYNKVPAWADESVDDWFQALIKYTDIEAEKAVRQICRTRKTLPNVAAVIEAIQGARKSAGAVVGSEPTGCAACGLTGWREVVHHLHSRGKLQVTEYLAACDCAAGMRLNVGPTVEPWEDLVKRCRDDPFTVAVYHGTHTEPHVPRDQRLHPDALARIQASPRPASAGAWQHLTGAG